MYPELRNAWWQIGQLREAAAHAETGGETQTAGAAPQLGMIGELTGRPAAHEWRGSAGGELGRVST